MALYHEWVSAAVMQLYDVSLSVRKVAGNLLLKIFTLTYVKRYPNRDFRPMARKSRFLSQKGSADNQRFMKKRFCQESREGHIGLQ